MGRTLKKNKLYYSNPKKRKDDWNQTVAEKRKKEKGRQKERETEKLAGVLGYLLKEGEAIIHQSSICICKVGPALLLLKSRGQLNTPGSPPKQTSIKVFRRRPGSFLIFIIIAN